MRRFLAAVALALFAIPAFATDHGQYAASELKTWFDSLASGKGPCCSYADGVTIQDVDWETRDGRFRVKVDGEWIVVQDEALVTTPNRYGPAVVWPYKDSEGKTQIRCFIPGTMS